MLSRLKVDNGFTLIEILVVVSIIAILTVVVVVSYKPLQGDLTLQRAAIKFSGDIRRAEAMAMSGKNCESCGGFPAGGYGIYINKNSPNSYYIYADNNGNERYDSGEEEEKINVEKGAFISNLIPDSANFSINFKPPDPTVEIKDMAGSDKENITIIISLAADSTKTKTITVNKAGLIDVK